MATRSRRNLWRATLVVLCLLLALIVWLVLQGTRSGVLVTIGKDTTYITAPLRSDGYPDYIGALNQRLSKGVTPENNSAVLFLRAMGPNMLPPEIRQQYLEMLGTPPLPPRGDYFVDVEEYAKGRPDAAKLIAAGGSPGGFGESLISEQYFKAMERPWSRKEFPALADWLAANENPLALLAEAAKRPRRYDPLLSADGIVIAAQMPAVLKSREASRAFSVRAMLRMHDGDLDGAWEDILACHRLARLEAQGPTIIDQLAAVTIDGMASARDEEMLRQPKLSAARIARIRADLAHLPPMRPMAEKVNIGERFMILDAVCSFARDGFARNGVGSAQDFFTGQPHEKDATDRFVNFAARALVDCDVALRMGNSMYDRLAEALRKPTRAQRQKAVANINSDVAEMMKKAKDPSSLAWSFLSGPRRAASQWAGQLLVGMLTPAISAASEAEDSWRMRWQVTELAFALAAYRADHGTYPATLAELKPKYVQKVPTDMFNGEADLHYTRKGGGYRLYSVGPNGIDDGGRGYADREKSTDPASNQWDDIGVRVGEEKQQAK
jgi:hypothetical protein